MAKVRVAYALALSVCLVALFASGSAVALAGCLFLVAVAAIDGVSCALVRATLTCSASLPESCEHAHGRYMSLEMQLSSPFLSLMGGVSAVMVEHNIMRSINRRQQLRLMANFKTRAVYQVPVDISLCGRIELSFERARVMGLMGIFALPAALPKSLSCDVLPALREVRALLERAPQAALSGVSYDPHLKGSDRSETFALREYVVGDLLSSVHWKLSSKLGQLTIREASRPADYNLLILVDLGIEPETGDEPSHVPDDLLAVAASLSNALFEMGLKHDLAFFDDGVLEVTHVQSGEAVIGFLREAVVAPAPASVGGSLHALRTRADVPYTKVVALVSGFDTGDARNLARRVDLDVIAVADNVSAGQSTYDDFTVLSLPTGAFEREIRSVSV